jgi:hypothetical protein
MRMGGAGGKEKGSKNANLYIATTISFLQVIIMGELKNRIIRLIGQDAAKEVSDLAGQYVRAKSGQKEAICDAIEIQRCVAESCQECLG